jgi:hypothetical protein
VQQADVEPNGETVPPNCAFYQLPMKFDWDDAGLGKSLTESRNNARMLGKGEPYTEQERFSHVKPGMSSSPKYHQRALVCSALTKRLSEKQILR